jgi:hypothetical protein
MHCVPNCLICQDPLDHKHGSVTAGTHTVCLVEFTEQVAKEDPQDFAPIEPVDLELLRVEEKNRQLELMVSRELAFLS